MSLGLSFIQFDKTVLSTRECLYSRTRHYVPLCALLFLLALVSACGGGVEYSKGPDELLKPGKWTVKGIAIGDSLTDVKATLERPAEPTRKKNGLQQYTFRMGKKSEDGEIFISDDNLYVTVDADNVVTEVTGSPLLFNGKNILGWFDEESVLTTLGKGYVKKTYIAEHDFIAIGSIHTHTDVHYHDGENTQLIISFNKRSRATKNRTAVTIRQWLPDSEEKYY